MAPVLSLSCRAEGAAPRTDSDVGMPPPTPAKRFGRRIAPALVGPLAPLDPADRPFRICTAPAGKEQPKPPCAGKRALSAPHGASPVRRHSSGALELRLELAPQCRPKRPPAINCVSPDRGPGDAKKRFFPPPWRRVSFSQDCKAVVLVSPDAKDSEPRRFDPMVGGGSFIDPGFFDSLLGSPTSATSEAKDDGSVSSDDDDGAGDHAPQTWTARRCGRRHTIDIPNLENWDSTFPFEAKAGAVPYSPQRTLL